tara:strand:+ start:109 stop:396 length:288 start_codon:yes stop_codon:yes gene_type:complete
MIRVYFSSTSQRLISRGGVSTTCFPGEVRSGSLLVLGRGRPARQDACRYVQTRGGEGIHRSSAEEEQAEEQTEQNSRGAEALEAEKHLGNSSQIE